jgi:hypothetical protein
LRKIYTKMCKKCAKRKKGKAVEAETFGYAGDDYPA